jgi:hypothetical protein
MMVFHEIEGYNSYCGPGVLATLLGITTDEAARQIREITGQRRVIGTPRVAVFSILRNYGWKWFPIKHNLRTFGRLIEDAGEFDPGVYLVTTTTHYLVVQKVTRLPSPLWSGWFVVDNHVGKPTEIEYHTKFHEEKIEFMERLVKPTTENTHG